MGVIWTSKTRTRQPQGTPPLRSGGLRGGLTPLLAASAPNGRWGLSSKSGLVLSDVGTPAYGTDPVFGSILQPTSGNYVRISGMPNTGYPFTVAMFARKNRTNGAGASRTFAFGADDFSSYQHSFFHQDNQVYSYDTGGYSASLANLTTKWTLVVCVFESASSRSLYNVIDGVVSSANEGSLVNVSPWPLKLSIGQSGWNTNEWFGGDLALPMFFAGAASAATVLELYSNPWQLFAPSRTPSFFGAAGGGGTTYNISISETASASEIAGAVAAFLASISETSTASETVSMLASLGTSISETATASETVATTAVLNASIIETATASETVSMAASFVVTIGETATASETVAMALGAATFAVDISETATASETVSMLATFGTSISETATASDLVSMLALFQVGISETATASETVAMQLANQTYAVSISETATASDTVVMTIPTTYAISIIETVQAGDYVSMGVPSSDFWTQVTTTQSAGWGQINNTQSSGWTIIPTT